MNTNNNDDDIIFVPLYDKTLNKEISSSSEIEISTPHPNHYYTCCYFDDYSSAKIAGKTTNVSSLGHKQFCSCVSNNNNKNVIKQNGSKNMLTNVVYLISFVCLLALLNVFLSPYTTFYYYYYQEQLLSTENDESLRGPKKDDVIAQKNISADVEKVPDIFITVKTTLKYHSTRLPDILDTWFQMAPNNIYFVTDAPDEEVNRRSGGHVIVSNCPAAHTRQALCCKLAAEYDAYLKSVKNWFCHFDDDNYVNIPKLIEILAKFDPRQDWYLGKSSTSRPIEIVSKESSSYTEKISFWFATGGAGFCLSRSLALKIAPLAANGKFIDVGERIRLPDDVTMGFIIEHLLKVQLVVVPSFHSHLESMKNIPVEQLKNQVSLSAGGYSKKHKNILNVENLFGDDDPNRFKSLHCKLYAESSQICQKIDKSKLRI